MTNGNNRAPILLLKYGPPASGKGVIEKALAKTPAYKNRQLVEQSINNQVEGNAHFQKNSLKTLHNVLKLDKVLGVNAVTNTNNLNTIKKKISTVPMNVIKRKLKATGEKGVGQLGRPYLDARRRSEQASSLTNQIKRDMRNRKNMSFETTGARKNMATGEWTPRDFLWLMRNNYDSNKAYKVDVMFPLRPASDAWNSYVSRTAKKLSTKGQRHMSTKRAFFKQYIASYRGFLKLLENFRSTPPPQLQNIGVMEYNKPQNVTKVTKAYINGKPSNMLGESANANIRLVKSKVQTHLNDAVAGLGGGGATKKKTTTKKTTTKKTTTKKTTTKKTPTKKKPTKKKPTKKKPTKTRRLGS